MDRGQAARTGRWTLSLIAGASLAACGTITPKYAVHADVTHHRRPLRRTGARLKEHSTTPIKLAASGTFLTTSRTMTRPALPLGTATLSK